MEEILQAAGVRMAYLFGSRARGSEQPDSDFDVAVLFPSHLSTLERFDRAARLEAALRTCLARTVDLVVLNDATPLLAFEAVIRGRPLLDYDPDEIFHYEQTVRQRYEDFVYSQRFFTAARRARLGMA